MEEAKIITVLAQKGGAGKTTATMHLAGELAIDGPHGSRVLVIDADDEQESARLWAETSDPDHPFPADVVSLYQLALARDKDGESLGYFAEGYPQALGNFLRRNVDNYDYILIDSPPRISTETADAALRVSDLALIPVIPSPTDVWSVSGTENLVLEIQDGINPELEAYYLPSQVNRQATLSSVVRDVLEEFQLPVMHTWLTRRQSYMKAAANGTFVRRMAGRRDSRAELETENLGKEVRQILNVV